MGEQKRRQSLGFLGATNRFPQGSLGPHDEGELRIAISDADSRGNIHIMFGKEISWLAMPREQAIRIVKGLLTKAGAKRIEVEF